MLGDGIRDRLGPAIEAHAAHPVHPLAPASPARKSLHIRDFHQVGPDPQPVGRFVDRGKPCQVGVLVARAVTACSMDFGGNGAFSEDLLASVFNGVARDSKMLSSAISIIAWLRQKSINLERVQS
jgi:hypothetical protein